MCDCVRRQAARRVYRRRLAGHPAVTIQITEGGNRCLNSNLSSRSGFPPMLSPEHVRLPFWRELYGRRMIDVDIEPLGAHPFFGVRHLPCAAGPRRYGGNDVRRALCHLEAGHRPDPGPGFSDDPRRRLRACRATEPGGFRRSRGAVMLSGAEPSTTFGHGGFVTLTLPRAGLQDLVPDRARRWFGRSMTASRRCAC